MTSAKIVLLEALNILLVDWQKIMAEDADSEQSVQMRKNIQQLLALIESLEKGSEL